MQKSTPKKQKTLHLRRLKTLWCIKLKKKKKGNKRSLVVNSVSDHLTPPPTPTPHLRTLKALWCIKEEKKKKKKKKKEKKKKERLWSALFPSFNHSLLPLPTPQHPPTSTTPILCMFVFQVVKSMCTAREWLPIIWSMLDTARIAARRRKAIRQATVNFTLTAITRGSNLFPTSSVGMCGWGWSRRCSLLFHLLKGTTRSLIIWSA